MSLAAKMIKLKLSYFKHIRRKQSSLENKIMLGKIEGSRKGGKPNTDWINSELTEWHVAYMQRARDSTLALLHPKCRLPQVLST